MLSCKYSENFESPLIKGSEEIFPWDFIKKVSTHLNTNNNLLDIGCSTANRILPLTSHLKYGIGL